MAYASRTRPKSDDGLVVVEQGSGWWLGETAPHPAQQVQATKIAQVEAERADLLKLMGFAS